MCETHPSAKRGRLSGASKSSQRTEIRSKTSSRSKERLKKRSNWLWI